MIFTQSPAQKGPAGRVPVGHRPIDYGWCPLRGRGRAGGCHERVYQRDNLSRVGHPAQLRWRRGIASPLTLSLRSYPSWPHRSCTAQRKQVDRPLDAPPEFGFAPLPSHGRGPGSESPPVHHSMTLSGVPIALGRLTDRTPSVFGSLPAEARPQPAVTSRIINGAAAARCRSVVSTGQLRRCASAT